MIEDLSVFALIAFSVGAASGVYILTGSILLMIIAFPIYPCLGAFVIRICEWLREEAADEPEFFNPDGPHPDWPEWTQLKRVYFGSAWPGTLLVSVVYYGFLIIVKRLY